MELQEFAAQSSEVVNELSRAIENQQIGLKEVWRRESYNSLIEWGI